MDLGIKLSPSRQIIQRYGAGSFTIAGKRWEEPVLVTPLHTEAWKITIANLWDASHFAMLDGLSPKPELLLIGCGANQMPVPEALRQMLRNQNIACDSMNSGAACRSFNLLTAEERRVAALLVPV